MHELGLIIEVVKSVEAFAKQNGITKVETLVLQIGELSSTIPKYVEECFPCAVDGTMLQDTKLEIEILPGNGLCQKCSNVLNMIQNQGTCPKCGSKEIEVISGKEFMIKHIVGC